MMEQHTSQIPESTAIRGEGKVNGWCVCEGAGERATGCARFSAVNGDAR